MASAVIFCVASPHDKTTYTWKSVDGMVDQMSQESPVMYMYTDGFFLLRLKVNSV